jgi:hypothetical protein
MDEIGAALDALRPRVAITYAEAGGSGRALVLEARRRGIRVVGLQHGFIYRHWLNYLHETDEMAPSPGNPADLGFPRPDLTLLYDQFAARHLVEAGRFPAESLSVSGSPKLDAFVGAGRAMDEAARAALRAAVGAQPHQHLVVVATKFTQIAPAFDALIEAVTGMPDVQLVVKCHPAETAAPYERAARGAANVRIAPSVASPNSPRNGPELPISGEPSLPISRAVSPCGPLSDAKTNIVLLSMPSALIASRTCPT